VNGARSSDMRAFMVDAAARGPTAAQGVYKGFEFVQRHLGLRIFHLASPLVAQFARATPGHMECQRDELPIAAFFHLLALARGEACTLQLVASMILRVLASVLRCAHAERAS